MEDTPRDDSYPALMQPRITQPKARPFRVVASERHYPLAGWRRCWSRGDPHPFEFEDSGRPCAAPDGDGWRVEVRDATDQEGWRYGTAFERLNDHRKGGRAAKRSTDRCRRRVWVHCVDAGPAPVEDEDIVEASPPPKTKKAPKKLYKVNFCFRTTPTQPTFWLLY